MNSVFANHSEEEEIYPLTVKEIKEAQEIDKTLLKSFILDLDKCLLKTQHNEKYNILLVENMHVLCKDGKIVIPQSLQNRAVSWYHHYLQHPGSTRLEETLRAVMYWNDMRSTVQKTLKLLILSDQ